MSDEFRPVGEDDLQAFVDDRLPSSRKAMVDAYLASDADAAARVAAHREQRQMLRDALRFKADEPLPARLRIENVGLHSGSSWRRFGALAAALVVAFGIGGLGGWYGRDVANGIDGFDRTQIAVGAHRVFVADLRRPVEIRAESQDQLVQWLSNRLEQAVSIPDLSAAGLRFMGGRLIATPTGPAAQLMYDDDEGTRLTIFLETEAGIEPEAERYAKVAGVGALSWTDSRFHYTVSAASEPERLALVGDLVRRQMPAPRTRS